MIDPFLLLAPVLLLGLVALLGFVGCSFHVIARPPAIPTGLVATAGNGVVDLGWTGVQDADSYQLTRIDAPPLSPSPMTFTSTAPSYTDTSVTNGTRYCYTVQAVNSSGSSNPSDQACATPAILPGRPPGSILDRGSPLYDKYLIGLFLMNEGNNNNGNDGQPADDKNLVDGQPANHAGAAPPTWDVADPSVVFHGGASLNSFLDAGVDATFNDLPTSQITVVAKVSINALATGGICEKNDDNTVDSGFVFGMNNNGALRLQVELSVTDVVAETASGVLTPYLGQWVQVAFTWNGAFGNNAPASAATLFVNGVPQANVNTVNGVGNLDTSKGSNSQPFRIGNAGFGVPGSLNGKIAYLAIYKGRLLPPGEMMTLDTAFPITPG